MLRRRFLPILLLSFVGLGPALALTGAAGTASAQERFTERPPDRSNRYLDNGLKPRAWLRRTIRRARFSGYEHIRRIKSRLRKAWEMRGSETRARARRSRRRARRVGRFRVERLAKNPMRRRSRARIEIGGGLQKRTFEQKSFERKTLDPFRSRSVRPRSNTGRTRSGTLRTGH